MQIAGQCSHVSILTRAFARVQQMAAKAPTVGSVFQSSLELSPECNVYRSREGVAIVVSILTRAFARVQPNAPARILAISCVSILTRAFARVQHVRSANAAAFTSRFNPHSSFRPSATPGRYFLQPQLRVSILTRAFARVQRCGFDAGQYLVKCFNPHSSFRPSATANRAIKAMMAAKVSILTRAFARVQPSFFQRCLRISAFQSSLELSPECNP